MPPRTPPVSLGQSRPADTAGARAAGPGEVAFAWSSIRGGTGAAMADCANIQAGRWSSGQVRRRCSDKNEAKETLQLRHANLLMATGRQTASRRSMCSVQQIGDDEKRERESKDRIRSSEVSSGPGKKRKADSNQLKAGFSFKKISTQTIVLNLAAHT